MSELGTEPLTLRFSVTRVDRDCTSSHIVLKKLLLWKGLGGSRVGVCMRCS